jgi:hypothetical protein
MNEEIKTCASCGKNIAGEPVTDDGKNFCDYWCHAERQIENQIEVGKLKLEIDEAELEFKNRLKRSKDFWDSFE